MPNRAANGGAKGIDQQCVDTGLLFSVAVTGW